MKTKQVGYPVRLRPGAWDQVTRVCGRYGLTPGKVASMLVCAGHAALFEGADGQRVLAKARVPFAAVDVFGGRLKGEGGK